MSQLKRTSICPPATTHSAARNESRRIARTVLLGTALVGSLFASTQGFARPDDSARHNQGYGWAAEQRDRGPANRPTAEGREAQRLSPSDYGFSRYFDRNRDGRLTGRERKQAKNFLHWADKDNNRHLDRGERKHARRAIARADLNHNGRLERWEGRAAKRQFEQTRAAWRGAHNPYHGRTKQHRHSNANASPDQVDIYIRNGDKELAAAFPWWIL